MSLRQRFSSLRYPASLYVRFERCTYDRCHKMVANKAIVFTMVTVKKITLAAYAFTK